MSNVGWHRLNASPTVNQGTQEVQPIEKHEYIPPMRMAEGMSEGQRETVRRYNSMREKLIQANLMESK